MVTSSCGITDLAMNFHLIGRLRSIGGWHRLKQVGGTD